jgi:glyoxylase-like metal-dependent hydrolase (beta-lactamase superfamily II)
LPRRIPRRIPRRRAPASIGLFDEAGGALFSGDVVYDDFLIDDCVGSDVGKYRDSM